MSVTGIDKETIRRLAKDVRDIIKNPLIQNKIFYKHDEENILRGKALIMGPKETPYANGSYLFEFEFPINYPHSPPKVIYYTNDGLTRMHPNLYRSGKVCISLLNTWKGDQWSSCQTISSVLLTLCTILTKNPLLNEPGVKETDKDIENYNKIINYKNISIGIVDVLNKNYFIEKFSVFRDIICDEFRSNYNKILECIDKNMKYNGYVVATAWYSSTTKIHNASLNYKQLRENIEKLYNKIGKI